MLLATSEWVLTTHACAVCAACVWRMLGLSCRCASPQCEATTHHTSYTQHTHNTHTGYAPNVAVKPNVAVQVRGANANIYALPQV